MTFYVFELFQTFSRMLALTRALGGRAVVDSVTSMYGTDRQTDGRTDSRMPPPYGRGHNNANHSSVVIRRDRPWVGWVTR